VGSCQSFPCALQLAGEQPEAPSRAIGGDQNELIQQQPFARLDGMQRSDLACHRPPPPAGEKHGFALSEAKRAERVAQTFRVRRADHV